MFKKLTLCLSMLYIPLFAYGGIDVYWTGGYDTTVSTDVWKITNRGDLLPGFNGRQSIGDSNFKISSVTAHGTLAVDGATTLNGALTLNAAATTVSTVTFNTMTVKRFTSQTGIYASTSIIPTSSFMVLQASAGTMGSMTSTPNIATNTAVTGGTNYANGTYLLLTSTSSTGYISLIDNDTLSGSLVELNNSSRTIASNDYLELMFLNGSWWEVNYNTK